MAHEELQSSLDPLRGPGSVRTSRLLRNGRYSIVSGKTDDSAERRKTQAQRLLEFEMWNNEKTLKDLEYSMRRSEKKQKRKERKKLAQHHVWKKLYLPAIVAMFVGTFLTLSATLQSLGQGTGLWDARGALVIIGPVLTTTGFVTLILAAACTFKTDQVVKEKPIGPPNEFGLFGFEVKNKFQDNNHQHTYPGMRVNDSRPRTKRSASVDTTDMPLPDDLDPNSNYLRAEVRRGSRPRGDSFRSQRGPGSVGSWGATLQQGVHNHSQRGPGSVGSWGATLHKGVHAPHSHSGQQHVHCPHSSGYLPNGGLYSSTASWVRYVSAAHRPHPGVLTRQSSDSNLLLSSSTSQVPVQLHPHSQAVVSSSTSHAELQQQLVESLTSSGYQSASGSLVGTMDLVHHNNHKQADHHQGHGHSGRYTSTNLSANTVTSASNAAAAGTSSHYTTHPTNFIGPLNSTKDGRVKLLIHSGPLDRADVKRVEQAGLSKCEDTKGSSASACKSFSATRTNIACNNAHSQSNHNHSGSLPQQWKNDSCDAGLTNAVSHENRVSQTVLKNTGSLPQQSKHYSGLMNGLSHGHRVFQTVVQNKHTQTLKGKPCEKCRNSEHSMFRLPSNKADSGVKGVSIIDTHGPNPVKANAPLPDSIVWASKDKDPSLGVLSVSNSSTHEANRTMSDSFVTSPEPKYGNTSSQTSQTIEPLSITSLSIPYFSNCLSITSENSSLPSSKDGNSTTIPLWFPNCADTDKKLDCVSVESGFSSAACQPSDSANVGACAPFGTANVGTCAPFGTANVDTCAPFGTANVGTCAPFGTANVGTFAPFSTPRQLTDVINEQDSVSRLNSEVKFLNEYGPIASYTGDLLLTKGPISSNSGNLVPTKGPNSNNSENLVPTNKLISNNSENLVPTKGPISSNTGNLVPTKVHRGSLATSESASSTESAANPDHRPSTYSDHSGNTCGETDDDADALDDIEKDEESRPSSQASDSLVSPMEHLMMLQQNSMCFSRGVLCTDV